MTYRLHLIGSTILAAGLCCPPAYAQQQPLIYESSEFPGGRAQFYGQFDPAFQYIDDGVGSTSTLVDNTSSNSRIGVNIDQDFGEDSLRFNFETALGLRASDSVSQDFEPDAIDWDRTKIRKVEFIWQASYGDFFVGQGSMATDGTAGFDASGTTLVNSSALSDFAGSFQFRDSTGALSGIDIGDVFKNLDGSRRMRLRYDTPSFSGFKFRAAAGQEVLRSGDNADYYDAALVYENTFGGAEVGGSLGWATKRESDVENKDQIVGSVSVLLSSGLNFAIAAGQEQQGNEGSYVYSKLGYLADFWSVGETRFSIDYNVADDFESVGSEGTALGLGVVQRFDDQNIEAYAGYIQYDLEDTSATTYQDLSSLLVGARWRF